jgi:hypothetical protein
MWPRLVILLNRQLSATRSAGVEIRLHQTVPYYSIYRANSELLVISMHVVDLQRGLGRIGTEARSLV